MNFSEGFDVSALSNLLEESTNASKSIFNQETQPPVETAKTKIVTKTHLENGHPSSGSKLSGSNSDPYAIWKDTEIPNEEDLIDIYDKRPQPKYEYSYKQMVGTEDTFLGTTDKTPSSTDCTHLVIKIHFPGASLKSLELDVQDNRIKASSISHRLFTYLPVTVNSSKGIAKFDSKKEVLTITIPIIREDII